MDQKNKTGTVEAVSPSYPMVNTKIESATDEENVLTAFGDISLSTIDFIPGPPSALSPARKPPRDNKSGDAVRLHCFLRLFVEI